MEANVIKFTAVCSNPECKFSRNYSYEEGTSKRCPMCAHDLLYNCPECSYAIKTKDAVHCEDCGRPLKQPAAS